MILKLLIRLLAAKLDAEAAKATPIGSSVVVKGVARGIRLAGGRWSLDCILHRDE